MAWTVPRTWGATEVVTAALLNEQVRDNLNETMCAKARTRGGFFCTAEADTTVDTDDASHKSIVERNCGAQRIAAAEQLDGAVVGAGNFADLATVGPVVTVNTGQQALVFMSATIFNDATAFQSLMSWGVSGATNRETYFDPISLIQDGAKQPGASWNFSQVDHMKGLVPGVNTFTCKYRLGSTHKATFANRLLAVWPL
jgi:hypothetical protein